MTERSFRGPLRPHVDPHLGDAISGLLDGEMPLPTELSARQHLASCGLCTDEYERTRAARTWVRALPAAEPPFGFYEGLLGDAWEADRPLDLDRARPHPWLARRSVRLAMGAASSAAAVLLIGFVSPRQAPVSPPVNRMVEAHATGASVNGDPLSRLAPIGVPISFRR